MSRSSVTLRVFVIQCMFVPLFFLAGCSGGGTQIETSIGQLTIIKTEIVEEVQLSGGWTLSAQEDRQLVLLWLNGDTTRISGLSTDRVYILGDDGSRTKVAFPPGPVAVGEKSSDMRIMLTFIAPVSAKTFTLDWPGNPSVELSLSK